MRSTFFLLFFLFFVITLFAQKVAMNDVYSVKDAFEQKYGLVGSKYNEIPIILKNDTLAFVFSYKTEFVVVSTYKQLPPIKVYSLENAFPTTKESNISFEDIIADDLYGFLHQPESKSKNESYKSKNSQRWDKIKNYGIVSSKSQYGPFLENLYGQVNCKNNLGNTVNVTNYYTPSNYAAGCVAITFVELLQYHQWPRRGVGSHTYSDNYGSTKGSHSADFEKKYYNWAFILNEYHHKSTSSKERAALGNLTYHCAVSVNMDFEYNGSTSNINRIPNAARKHFRFTSRYLEKSNSAFWPAVDQSIIKGLPVQFAIYTPSGAGHAVVGDGLKPNEDLYHLNMGWWGSTNAWYTIQGSFNAGGYTNITAAVVDFIPIAEIAEPEIDIENETVDLKWYYPTTITPDAYHLQVKVGVLQWEDVDSSISDNSFSYDYKNDEVHRFRVKAKVFGNWVDDSWSEFGEIDIKNELSKSLPSELAVYPTIVLDKITIESKYMANSIIEIFSTTGLRVYFNEIPSSFSKSSLIVDLSFLSKGMYILRLTNENEIQTSTIIKL